MSQAALSPARYGADALAAVKQLVLDAVSSPLTRVMYACLVGGTARTGDKWHLDEVFLKINGATHYLWRASIRMALFSTSLCNRNAIGLPPSGSFASCCVPEGADRA